jgi:hypothetical protein
MDSAYESDRTGGKRGLIVAEERAGPCQRNREFVGGNGGAEVSGQRGRGGRPFVNCENPAQAVDHRDYHRVGLSRRRCGLHQHLHVRLRQTFGGRRRLRRGRGRSGRRTTSPASAECQGEWQNQAEPEKPAKQRTRCLHVLKRWSHCTIHYGIAWGECAIRITIAGPSQLLLRRVVLPVSAFMFRPES